VEGKGGRRRVEEGKGGGEKGWRSERVEERKGGGGKGWSRERVGRERW